MRIGERGLGTGALVVIVVGIVVAVVVPLTYFSVFGPSEEDVSEEEKSLTIIDGPSGTSISVPLGAAPPGAEFTIQELDPSTASELPEWADNVISLYDFSVDQPLQGSVTIEIPIPDAELAVLGHYYDENWEVMFFEVEDGKAVVEVENLSPFSWFKVNVSDLSDRIRDFLTLRWLVEKEKPSFSSDSGIIVDESGALGMILGRARFIDEDEVNLLVYNDAPVHLEVYPAEYPPGKVVELKRTTFYAFGNHVVLAPGSWAEWTVQLAPEESVTFEAYFSNWAVGGLVVDIIPYGRITRRAIERSVFAGGGQVMGWADIKSTLIIPVYAEISKTLEEYQEMYPILTETSRITFMRIKLLEPSSTDQGGNLEISPEYQERVKAKLEQWLEEHRYEISEWGAFGWPLDITIDDYAFVGEQVWAVGYLHGIGGYGHVFHTSDDGDTWEIQWTSSTYGPDPFEVEFLDEKEGWVATNNSVLYTLDGGKTWNSIWERPVFGGWLRGFQVIDRGHLYCSLSSGSTFYLYTPDQGETWQVQ